VQLATALHGRFVRVVIHTLMAPEEGKTGTYLASAYVAAPDGSETALDCRPSDGIALAVRTGAPIFVSNDVYEQSAIVPKS
jgi:bifunctional DNase/RNase